MPKSVTRLLFDVGPVDSFRLSNSWREYIRDSNDFPILIPWKLSFLSVYIPLDL